MEHVKTPVVVADIIRDVVAKVATAYGTPVQYIHDTPDQVEAWLLKKGALQVIKYPAIILLHDFPEEIGDAGGYYGIVTIPTIMIVTNNSLTNQFSEDRYAKTFRPVLYPLLALFTKYLSQHKDLVVGGVENLRYRKIDHLNWGIKKFGDVLNDYVDGIELQNLKLTLKQYC